MVAFSRTFKHGTIAWETHRKLRVSLLNIKRMGGRGAQQGNLSETIINTLLVN